MLGLLLRQRLRLFWNRLVRGPRRIRRVFGTGLTMVFTVAFITFAGLNGGVLIDRISRADHEAAADALPVLLIGITALTVLTSMGSAFHHLFLAGDLDILLAPPVPSSSFFWLKVLEIWRDSLHVLLFQAAALFGYGMTLRMPPLYYPLALLVGTALTVGAAAAGALLTLLLARIRYGEPILGLARLLTLLFFVPIGVLGVPTLGSGGGRFSLLVDQNAVQSVAGALRAMGRPPTWAPTTWAAHLLLGDDAAGLSLALLVATGVLLVASTQLVFDLLFQGGLERVRYAGPRRQRSATGHGRLLVSGPVFGLVQKDWRTLLRDPRWRTGAVISVVALGLPAMLLFAGDPFARASHATRFWLGMLPVPYLAYLFGSQQGATTLAYEGRNITLLRAAPVGMRRVMLAKLLGGLVLVWLVTWVATLALGVSHGGEPLEMGAALLAASWLASGATLAAVAGAALTIDFDTDNPQRRVGCLGTIVTSSLSLFFFVSNTALVVWWVARANVVALPRPLLAFLPLVDWALPASAVLSVAAIVLASGFGARRLAGWETS